MRSGAMWAVAVLGRRVLGAGVPGGTVLTGLMLTGLVVTGSVLASGCTSKEEPAPVEGVTLGEADLARLVAVRPEATGWKSTTWTVIPGPTKPFTRAELDKGVGLDPSDPSFALRAELTGAMQDAGFVASRNRAWQGVEGVAHSFADIYDTRDRMEDALRAGRSFAEDWYPKFEHHEIRVVDAAAGLGDDSWAVRGKAEHPTFVELSWVRGNALLGVYLTCSRCPTDIEVAARRWADAIDKRARSAAG